MANYVGNSTSFGTELYSEHLLKNISKFCLIGYPTQSNGTLGTLLSGEDIKYSDLGSFNIYESRIEYAEIDDNGQAVFDCLIPYDLDLKKYIYGVALLYDKDGKKEVVDWVTITPFYQEMKLGGTIRYKTSADGKNGDIIFSNGDFITKSEFNNKMSIVDINIATNVTSIEQNKTDIATNTNNIDKNKTDISNNDIAINKNKTDIATNTNNIDKNKIDSATNKTAINKNKTDIATNKTAINKNKTDIATNTNTINKNKTDIQNLKNAGNLDEVAKQVDANKNATNKNKTDIATNKTAINKNKTDIATNKNATNKNKTDIATNKNATNKNKTDIATNKTAINKNKTDITNLKQSVETNTLHIDDNYNQIGIIDDEIQPIAFSTSHYEWTTDGSFSPKTILKGNDVGVNIQNCYNSSTGIFTCPKSGYYVFNARVFVSTDVSGRDSDTKWTNDIIFYIIKWKNGSSVSEDGSGGYAHGKLWIGELARVGPDHLKPDFIRSTASDSCVIYMNSGDKVGLCFYYWQGSSTSDKLSIDFTFSGHKL